MAALTSMSSTFIRKYSHKTSTPLSRYLTKFYTLGQVIPDTWPVTTLDQMKLYELATGETMLGEISKKQKDIFSAFKISKSIKPSKKI